MQERKQKIIDENKCRADDSAKNLFEEVGDLLNIVFVFFCYFG